MVSTLSCQDLDVDYTDLTLQPDEGGEMSPQDGTDENLQPPAPRASTSSVVIAGDSGYRNPPIASKLHPIPRWPNIHADVFLSPSAEDTSDTEGEIDHEVVDPPVGTCTSHDDVDSHLPCVSCGESS